MEDKKARKLQKELIGYAKEIAKSYGYSLDYTDNSIKTVESILTQIHNDYKKSKDSDGLDGIAFEFGFYIMAVIEKNYGKGLLGINDEVFGENTFPFYIGTITAFPIEWCKKRIYDGKADDVYTKYKTLISRLERTPAKKQSFIDMVKDKFKK